MEFDFTREDFKNMALDELARTYILMLRSYGKIYDEYYETGSRDSAFLKDLADSLIGISAVLNVYADDGKIHPDYVIEKLSHSKSIIESCIEFYKSKGE